MKTPTCRSCGVEIVWLMTKNGRWMPVEPETVEEGDDEYDQTKHTSHFDTCPDSAAYRRPAAKNDGAASADRDSPF